MVNRYYAMLGISPGAGREEIKAAYRRLAKEHHPDHAGGDSEKFKDIQEAYSVLVDSGGERSNEGRAGSPKVRVRVRTRPAAQAYAAGPEPLIPEQEPTRMGHTRRSRAYTADSPDDLFEWVLRRFF